MIYDKSVVELVRLMRIVKRQLSFLRSSPLSTIEKEKLTKAIDALQEEFNIFKT